MISFGELHLYRIGFSFQFLRRTHVKYVPVELTKALIGESQMALQRRSLALVGSHDSVKVVVRLLPQDVGGEACAKVTKIARMAITKTACEFRYA